MIGRDEAVDIALTWDAAVSRRHAAVLVQGSRAGLRDLGSRNGTFRGGVRLPENAVEPQQPGDLVRCGDTCWPSEGRRRRVTRR